MKSAIYQGGRAQLDGRGPLLEVRDVETPKGCATVVYPSGALVRTSMSRLRPAADPA